MFFALQAPPIWWCQGTHTSGNAEQRCTVLAVPVPVSLRALQEWQQSCEALYTSLCQQQPVPGGCVDCGGDLYVDMLDGVTMMWAPHRLGFECFTLAAHAEDAVVSLMQVCCFTSVACWCAACSIAWAFRHFETASSESAASRKLVCHGPEPLCARHDRLQSARPCQKRCMLYSDATHVQVGRWALCGHSLRSLVALNDVACRPRTG